MLALPSPFTYGYLATDTTLYSDPECLNPLTSLPATYFVMVLDEQAFYKVSYKDISGYVRELEIVDYEPVTKFATASFAVKNDGHPVKLRTEPSETAEVLIEIPDGKSGYYYGDVHGSALIQQVGTKWHYIAYADGDYRYRGYVYSSQVTVSEIEPNIIEKVEYNDEGEEQYSPPVNKPDFILIACLCVPSVLIMYLVFRNKERPRRKE